MYCHANTTSTLTPIQHTVRGGGGRAPWNSGRSVNPIQIIGGRLCHSHYCRPLGFKMLSTPLMLQNPISYLRRALYILYVLDSKLNYYIIQ